MPKNSSFENLVTRQQLTPGLRLKASQTIVLESTPTLVDGVFEGGGALGTAYLGGLKALHSNNIWFKRVAGNSAGSITAAMIAVGFTAPEIQWLSSSFPGSPALVPDTLSPAGITSPIPFADFLDLPKINSISQSSKRKTLLWNALKGSVLDEIGRIDLGIPTRGSVVNKIELAILNIPLLGDAVRNLNKRPALRTALNAVLNGLPNNELQICDFLPRVSENARNALADTLWDALMRNNPLQLLMTNLVHEGGMFKGTFFLNTIKRLFGRKVHNNPDATVLFKDLKIPLVVIASDIDKGQMMVYSSRRHPNMEVAEAVRQSMSIPFFFEPRGDKRQMLDGGLYSNFPVWVYSSTGDTHWNLADIDSGRVKIGFSLDETKAAPQTWNVQPPKFRLIGDPPRVNRTEVIKPILIDKVVELGMPVNAAVSAVNFALGQGTSAGNNAEPGLEILQQIVGVVQRGVMNTEVSTRTVTVAALMNGLPYIDVPIPLLGFDGLDFYVNEDEGPLMAMWDRAWRKTIEGLSDAAARHILPSGLAATTNTQTPFN